MRKKPLTPPAVQFDQLDSVPLAVIRRQASAAELSRVVPQCCGLVWNAVRAQKARAGRHIAIYWDGSIRLEVGVELYGPFAEEGEVVRSATPAGPVAWATQGRIAAWALRTMQFASGVEPTIANLRVQIGRYTATGKANGIRIHRRSEPISTTC
jgi:hypothetical protein